MGGFIREKIQGEVKIVEKKFRWKQGFVSESKKNRYETWGKSFKFKITWKLQKVQLWRALKNFFEENFVE